MGRLAGLMLMLMSEEEAFWLFVTTLENYMTGYFDTALSQLILDAAVLDRLIETKYSKLAKLTVSGCRNDWIKLTASI